MKYVETFELEDDTMSKTLRKELKTSQTKVAAFRAINLTYKKIINVMIYVMLAIDFVLFNVISLTYIFRILYILIQR